MKSEILSINPLCTTTEGVQTCFHEMFLFVFSYLECFLPASSSVLLMYEGKRT